MADLAAHSRFHVGVRVAIGVHGSQVRTAHDADQQALLLRAVLEGDEDAAPLLQGLVFCLVYLWGGKLLGCPHCSQPQPWVTEAVDGPRTSGACGWPGVTLAPAPLKVFLEPLRVQGQPP